ncbi:uncharacterized protein [Montipora capricornis]|uniref:uncharacterized protein n=1 Tax=Montipora capricornis TaxID=246305 RepID=UPI0035F1ECA5
MLWSTVPKAFFKSIKTLPLSLPASILHRFLWVLEIAQCIQMIRNLIMQKLSVKGSNSSRGSDNGNSIGEGTAVQLPRPAEGGRLECDRIIMADGTAIHLFDENDDSGVREKVHRRSREQQDEFCTCALAYGKLLRLS